MSDYIANLRKQCGISEDATEQEVQQEAIKLLDDATTNFYGAELLLDRRIDSSEANIVMLFALSPLAEDKTPIVKSLLLVKALDNQVIPSKKAAQS